MTQIEIRRPGPAGHVRLHGPLNLQTITAAHTALSETLGNHAQVTVALDAPEDVDLTLVQLLLSARRTALERGGSLDLAGPAEGGLLEILRRGGFVETPDQRAFWLHSNEDPA